MQNTKYFFFNGNNLDLARLRYAFVTCVEFFHYYDNYYSFIDI